MVNPPGRSRFEPALDYYADVLRGLAADYYNRRPSPISNMFDYPRQFLQLWSIAHDRYDGRSVVAGLVAAFLLAVDLLVRPVGILLPLLAPLPFLFLPRAVSLPRRMGLCLAAFALPAMVMGGWIARNAARTGTWTLSTNVAINLYYNNAGGVVGYLSDKSFPEVMNEFARERSDCRMRMIMRTPPRRSHRKWRRAPGAFSCITQL